MKILTNQQLKEGFQGAYHKLVAEKEELNRLNVFPVPDGDTGTNMSLTMKSAMDKVQVADENLQAILKGLASGALMGARGNSGVILSQLFRGLSEGASGHQILDISCFKDMTKGATEMAYNAVMKPTEGTILTVARAISEFAEHKHTNYSQVDEFIRDCLAEGQRMLLLTPTMLKELKEAGVVDAGGQGLIFILTGFYEAISGQMADEIFEEIEIVEQSSKKPKVVDYTVLLEESEIENGYCTEFFIVNREPDRHVKDLKKKLGKMGDSIVCVGMDDLIKVHIHTDDPGKVMSMAQKIGPLADIKVDSMRLQHSHKLIHEYEIIQEKDYGFVAVSLGQGFDDIFKSLMVDEVVAGGQTMNPSTQDLLEAVESVPAKNVFILPNNKNIIMAAEQVIELSDKNVLVIPSRSIPQGLTALFSFNEMASPEENKQAMTEAMGEVLTGQITYAIRDTQVNGLDIKESDLIALIDGDIVMNGQDLNRLLMDLLEKHVSEDHFLLSIYAGQDVSESDAQELVEKLEVRWEQLDVEYARGDQPTYYYVFSLE